MTANSAGPLRARRRCSRLFLLTAQPVADGFANEVRAIAPAFNGGRVEFPGDMARQPDLDGDFRPFRFGARPGYFFHTRTDCTCLQILSTCANIQHRFVDVLVYKSFRTRAASMEPPYRHHDQKGVFRCPRFRCSILFSHQAGTRRLTSIVRPVPSAERRPTC